MALSLGWVNNGMSQLFLVAFREDSCAPFLHMPWSFHQTWNTHYIGKSYACVLKIHSLRH